MTGEVKVQRLVVGIVADKGFQHADDFGAFFIDRCGVEIVDLLEFFWTHRMAEWALVLWELAGAQGDDVFDALYRFRTHVGCELRVAVNC